MKTTTLPCHRLSPEHIAAWSRIQASDPAFDSPYFRPEFTQAVAEVRDDVEVAVLEKNGEPVGFLPFQRTAWNVGKPVGGRMSDFQGVICGKGLQWNADALIRGCGLSTWDFDHLLESQQPFEAYRWKSSPSPYMDLSRGFEAYRATTQSQTISQVLRKARKMEREVGPLRLEPSTTNRDIFRTLLAWKSEQYRRTKALDIFTREWTVGLLENILERRGKEFSGMLTALYAGDHLAAVHMGMRAGSVLHCWFPAYNQRLQQYSPGLVLWMEVARAADELGIRRIDFGKGAGQYKTSLMSGAVQVAEGSVACNPAYRLWRHGARQAREWVRSSPLRAPARLLRRLHAWLTF